MRVSEGKGMHGYDFAARKIVAKSREHSDSLIVLFVDLKKAYNSVPKKALWCVIKKYSVPPMILSVVRSFHEDMTAVVREGDDFTVDIKVTNGLRQGCTLALTLLICTSVLWWHVGELGVLRQESQSGTGLGGSLWAAEEQTKSRPLKLTMTESQFVDDVAVYATTTEELEQVGAEFVKTAANWGLTVSLEKTKLLTLGKQLKLEDNLPVSLTRERLPLEEFTYLGSSITRDAEVCG